MDVLLSWLIIIIAAAILLACIFFFIKAAAKSAVRDFWEELELKKRQEEAKKTD